MSSLPNDPNTKKYWTVEEYFAWDEASDRKWEYLDGKIREVYSPPGEFYDMAGATVNHVRIVRNASVELDRQVRNRGCEVFNNDMRVQVMKKQRQGYVYPDVVIVCGKPEFKDNDNRTLLNPTMIVEVLSPSTALIDYEQKAAWYQAIATVQEYVIIAQSEPRLEVRTRQQEGMWTLRIVDGLESEVALDSLGCTLSLREIYRNVEWEPEA